MKTPRFLSVKDSSFCSAGQWRRLLCLGFVLGVSLLTLSFTISSAVAADVVYVLGSDGNLWRERGDKNDRDQVDDLVKAFRAVDERVIYVLGRDGRLWTEDGSKKERSLLATKAELVVFKENHPNYYLKEGSLYFQVGKEPEPELIESKVVAFQVKDENCVYILDADRKLWRVHQKQDKRDLIDDKVVAFQLSPRPKADLTKGRQQ